MVNKVAIYTDGACHPPSRTGSWVAKMWQNEEVVWLHKIEEDTTHQRMELTAVIEGVRAAYKQFCDFQIIDVYTDSQYVVDLPARRDKIEVQGFRTKKGRDRVNSDLLKQFFELLDQAQVHLHKVKAHQKQTHASKHNRAVDQLARKLLRKQVSNKK